MSQAISLTIDFSEASEPERLVLETMCRQFALFCALRPGASEPVSESVRFRDFKHAIVALRGNFEALEIEDEELEE